MSDRLANVGKFLTKINAKFKKKYGADVLFLGNDAGDFKPYQTGFPTIDHLNCGIGGLPRGGMTLIHGLESTGKSTLVLESITNHMNANPESTALYIDVENALTKDFLKYKEAHPDRLSISPLNTEDAFIVAEEAIKGNIYDLICIDSLAKMESDKILEKEMGESGQRNRRASIITEFLRRISFVLRHSDTELVMINQEIENQNKKSPYDPDTVLPCGKQQVYSANLRIQLKRSKKIKNTQGMVAGYQVSFTNLKCKISNKERARTYLSYVYENGFIREYSLLDYLVAIGVVKALPRKMFEFVSKPLYSETFKASEIINIAKAIKDNAGLDLFLIPPPENFEYEKGDVNVEDGDEPGGEVADE
jgi:recombination protein RecA